MNQRRPITLFRAGKRSGSSRKFSMASFVFIATAVFLLGTAGCSFLLPSGTPFVRLQLSPILPERIVQEPMAKQIVVAMPTAGQEFAGDAVVLLFGEREIRHLAGYRWTDRLPDLVQRFLIDALQSTGAFRGVGGDASGIAADLRVLADLRQFSVQYASEQAVPVAVFGATFRLLDFSSGKIIGEKIVDVAVPATGRSTEQLAGAVEKALGEGLKEFAVWVVDVAGAMPRIAR